MTRKEKEQKVVVKRIRILRMVYVEDCDGQ